MANANGARSVDLMELDKSGNEQLKKHFLEGIHPLVPFKSSKTTHGIPTPIKNTVSDRAVFINRFKQEKKPENKPCFCQSGKKFKNCCGKKKY